MSSLWLVHARYFAIVARFSFAQRLLHEIFCANESLWRRVRVTPKIGAYQRPRDHYSRDIIQGCEMQVEVSDVGRLLRRPVRFFVSEGSNIPRSRNTVLEQLQRAYPDKETVRVLWLDSDIVIFPGHSGIIGRTMKWAEEHHVCVVGNYRMASGGNVLMATRDQNAPVYHHYSDEELELLPKPYPGVGLAGLGFAYLEQPLAYRFYADAVGEDIHFWWDHAEMPIHWISDLRLGHRKSVLLV